MPISWAPGMGISLVQAQAITDLALQLDLLWWIGWNDRISSFRVQTSQSGKLYTDWSGGGAVLNFCCNSQVPFLNATFNNTISSVYRA